jgi:hypothetical protein
MAGSGSFFPIWGVGQGGGLPHRRTGLRPTTQEREAEAGRADGKGSK